MMVISALPSALTCLGHEGGVLTATSTKINLAVIVVHAGQHMTVAGPGDADAVFLLVSGATLKKAIIDKNQQEGVHCDGPCTLEFVWFEDVCEDAITIRIRKTWIIGGGAYHASDKIVQRNGCGTVNITSRSTGHVVTSQCKRNVYVQGTRAYDGGEFVGVSSNYGDTATLKSVCTGAAHPCQMYTGCSNGCEPVKPGYCSG
ncbi:putative Pectate lyase [Seiridium cardinale]